MGPLHILHSLSFTYWYLKKKYIFGYKFHYLITDRESPTLWTSFIGSLSSCFGVLFRARACFTTQIFFFLMTAGQTLLSSYFNFSTEFMVFLTKKSCLELLPRRVTAWIFIYLFCKIFQNFFFILYSIISYFIFPIYNIKSTSAVFICLIFRNSSDHKMVLHNLQRYQLRQARLSLVGFLLIL